MKLEEVRKGPWFRVSLPGVDRPRELTPPEKIALDRKIKFLNEKAESRQETCWAYDCTRAAVKHVREVGFDYKVENAAPVRHIALSSADIEGPVPGFCTLDLYANGARDLAEACYWNQPEIQYGAKPTRWWVIFTDGTWEGGSCVEIDPLEIQPDVKFT